jgi:type IV pilus assembly protein PilM
MPGANTSEAFSTRFHKLGPVRRVERWLQAMPHPSLVVEVASDHVAAARWGSSSGDLDSFAAEPLPAGCVMPSPVESNVTQPETVRGALRRVFSHVPDRGLPVALLIPDSVARVFILPFENLPRRTDQALPLLRWRLKKSVPFDVDETIVSWVRQRGRDGNLEVVTAMARQRIVQEYEELILSLGGNPAVVLSSTLATLPLLDETGATLLVRICGRNLTTVIVRGPNLCLYRATEMSLDPARLNPQAVLDEIFPAVAYYQDTWDEIVDRALISGFGPRTEIFRTALAEELKVNVSPLANGLVASRLDTQARDLVGQNLDALVGWMMNGGI